MPAPDAIDLPLLAFGGMPLYIGHVHWSNGEPSRTRAHRHPHPELAVAIGSATLLMDFEEHRISGMTAVMINVGVVHEWISGDGLQLWVVGMRPGAVAESGRWVEQLARAGPIRIPDDEADEVAAVLRMSKRRFEEDPVDPQRAAWFVRALLPQLAAWAGSGESTTPTDDLVVRFHTIVSERPAERNVADIAAVLGVSSGHLAMLVKERTGRTPKEILTDRTLLEAKRLLANTRLSAASIGWELGFADASEFGRFFRKHAGHSPGEFRSIV